MASIDETIQWIEKLPEDIRQRGIDITRESIVRNGHVDTGNMYNQVQGSASGDTVHIRVWCRYASLVNDGHAGAAPGHIMTFKESPKWPPVAYIRKDGWTTVHPRRARAVRGYNGSHFFDQAYTELHAYIQTL